MSLKLTDDAVDAVKELVSNAGDIGEGAGMRIVTNEAGDGQRSFALSVTTAPATDDEIVEEGGARVFVASDAAGLLDDKTLDASFGEGQRVAFSLADSPA